jgi:two-component system, response regulator PdtaR
MIFGEDKVVRTIAPALGRILVIDASPSGARLLVELLKGLGAKSVYVETTDAGALNACKTLEPQVIFTELGGKNLDGLAFVRNLRRSSLSCRQAPVIVVTGEATAALIVASRNAGVHEFLRKPFTIKDLTRRLEAVILRSRDWVEAINYIGPDRRRFNSGDYQGPRKRQADHQPLAATTRIRQALNILTSAIGAIGTDPAQALRAMQAQIADLRKVAAETGDEKLAAAAAPLQRYLAGASSNALSRAEIEAAAAGLWAFMPAEPETDSARRLSI